MPAASRSRAGLSLAVVHAEGVLEIAERPVRVNIVPERGSAGGDRLPDHVADAVGQPPGAGGVSPAGGGKVMGMPTTRLPARPAPLGALVASALMTLPAPAITAVPSRS